MSGCGCPSTVALSGHCLTTGKPVLCPDVLRDPRVKRDVIEPLGMRSAIYVPVSRGGANIGVLKLQSSRPDAFSGRDLRTATLFAGTIPAGLAEAGEAEARRGMRASEATLRTVMETLPVGVMIAEAAVGTHRRLQRSRRRHSRPRRDADGSGRGTCTLGWLPTPMDDRSKAMSGPY